MKTAHLHPQITDGGLIFQQSSLYRRIAQTHLLSATLYIGEFDFDLLIRLNVLCHCDGSGQNKQACSQPYKDFLEL